MSVSDKTHATPRSRSEVSLPNGNAISSPHVDNDLPVYKMSEVSTHSWKDKEQWVVIGRGVYNVTTWLYKHPGGPWVLKNYAGQDGTTAFSAFHLDTKMVEKYMKRYQIGLIDEQDRREMQDSEIAKDFNELYHKVRNLKLFEPNYFFYIACFLHIVALEMLSYFILYLWGTTWLGWILAAVIMATSQAQAGWLQHDFGHLSVCKSSRNNHIAHKFIIGFVKGAAASWWNWRHFSHHSKPNVMVKDPDITFPELFLFGKEFPKIWAKRHKNLKTPYNWQHIYFFILGPPMLLTLYFHYEITRHVIMYRQYVDILLLVSFLLRFIGISSVFLGLSGAILFYFFVRFLESNWFTWATQMSHIPMHVSYDEKQHWLPMQVRASTNVTPHPFTSWWSGHLNYQIEHHLFPMMPRHNYYKTTPLVKEICKKYDLEYTVKTTYRAFADIVTSMQDSGDIWYHTLQEL